MILAQTASPFWEDGRFILISLAFIALIIMIWATYLRIALTRQLKENKEQAIHDEEHAKLYAELIEHASDVVFRLDRNGNILAINNAGVELLGFPREKLLGTNLTQYMQRADGDSVFFEGSKERALSDLVLLSKDKQPVVLEMNLRRERTEAGKTKSVEVIARNVTERRRLEAQLRQSERMQAMGLLAGGIAHDFNNHLTVVLNFADLALEAKPSEDVASMLKEIRKAAIVASEMSRQMLDFSRRQVTIPVKVHLNTIISDCQRMLKSALGTGIDLKLNLATGLPRILADLGSVEQVLLNLILNARDAITDAGRVTIRTLPSEVDDKKVLLEITDTGAGMDEATQAQLFQPFFTTKETGKGTGLGLASVQRIVHKMGGTITVKSKLGQGTTFQLAFPVAN